MRTEVGKEPGIDPTFPTRSDHGYSLQACHRRMTRIELQESKDDKDTDAGGLGLNLEVFDSLPRLAA